MTGALTWLDYSERDRRRALQVIDLFRETRTIDELGLGRVNNRFSDLFFPGTSTIQTRACYFLLVPWMYRELERSPVSPDAFREKARSEELKINRWLRDGPDSQGVFGALAGDALKRLPSDVYWNGIRSWGISTFPGFKWPYIRSIGGFYRRTARHKGRLRDPEGRVAPPTNWHPHLPEPPTEFLKGGITVSLRRTDAEYLLDRIQARHPESLLGALAGRAVVEDLEAKYPWELACLPVVSSKLRAHLRDAERFAVCMQGASLLYNLMLAEQREHQEWQAKYQRRLADWANDVKALQPGVGDWDPRRVWRAVADQGPPLAHPMRAFVEGWVDKLKRGGPENVADDHGARMLVREREIRIKGARARLVNPRRLELWGGASGTWRLSYRWGAAKTILQDIFSWLTRSERDAANA